MIPKAYTDEDSFQREIDALLKVRENGSHPNICRLQENFEKRGNFYLVMDLIQGGEMFDHLAANGAYSEERAARLARETASALAFLHGIGLVHADLKPGESIYGCCGAWVSISVLICHVYVIPHRKFNVKYPNEVKCCNQNR